MRLTDRYVIQLQELRFTNVTQRAELNSVESEIVPGGRTSTSMELNE